jgi:hypothetical protein
MTESYIDAFLGNRLLVTFHTPISFLNFGIAEGEQIYAIQTPVLATGLHDCFGLVFQ